MQDYLHPQVVTTLNRLHDQIDTLPVADRDRIAQLEKEALVALRDLMAGYEAALNAALVDRIMDEEITMIKEALNLGDDE